MAEIKTLNIMPKPMPERDSVTNAELEKKIEEALKEQQKKMES